MAQVILEHVARAAAFDGVAVSMAQHATEPILGVRCKASLRTIDGTAMAAAATLPEQGLHDSARALGARLEIGDSHGAGLLTEVRWPLQRQEPRFQLPDGRRQPSDRRQGNIR